MKKLLPVLAMTWALIGCQTANSSVETTEDELPPLPPLTEPTIETYPECELLEHWFHPADYREVVEVDHPNKRIIVWYDDSDVPVYKSIAIFRNNQLKVIDLTHDQLLFHGSVTFPDASSAPSHS